MIHNVNENFKNVSRFEVENSKIYVYSYDANANDNLCASDTVNL